MAATYRDAGGFFVTLYATWQRIKTTAEQRPERLPQLLDVAMSAVEKENPEFEPLLPKSYSRAGLSAHDLAGLVRVVSAFYDREQAREPIALAQLTRTAAESLPAHRMAPDTRATARSWSVSGSRDSTKNSRSSMAC